MSNESLVFATQSLAGFEVGEEYTKWLHVTGGVPSYSFAVTEGDLPPGVEVTPLGTVNGVPLKAGSFKFSVEATDSAKNSGKQTFIVEVAPQPDPNGPKDWPLAWANETSALSMAVGTRYEFDLQAAATGGTPPYKFDIKEGSLPDGVNLAPAGYLVGTPSGAGHTRVVFGLYDAAGRDVLSGVRLPGPGEIETQERRDAIFRRLAD